MAAVAIKKKPTGTVNTLTAPTRGSGGSTTYTVTWKTASADFKDTNDHRATGFRWWWVINLKSTGGKTSKWVTKTYTSNNTSLSSLTLPLAGTTMSDGKVRGVDNLYPRVGTWYVTSISVNVQLINSKGYGPTKTATRTHWEARAPEVSELTQAEDSGHVSCTIKPDDGNDYRDRYDTRYVIDVCDTRLESPNFQPTNLTSAADTISPYYDVLDRLQLTYDQYVMVKVTAFSRGYTGPSSHVVRRLYVSWPKQPTIKAKEVTCPTRTQGGKVTIPINLNKTTEHPVTGCRLQALVNVEYENASDIPGDIEWTNVGVQDDGECTALSVATGDVMPEDRGKRSWIRVKSWNQIEDAFFQYSEYYQLEQLYVPAPTAEDDDCEIVSCTGADDGKGAIVVVGFDNDGNTGTEIAWSDREGAWTSTDQPDTFQATWEDGSAPSSDWDKGCTVEVRGLEDGTTYYIRARRYLENDETDVTTYSRWSDTKLVTPSVAPGAVTLVAPASVPRGSSCPLTWTFTGGVQTAWAVMHDGKVVASGNDAMGSCSIPSEKMDSIIGTDKSTTLSVTVTTSGGTSTSETVTVVVDDPPSIYVDGATVTAQPLSIVARCSTSNANVAVTVRSQGATSSSLGQDDQSPGDVIWSEVVSPEWGYRTLDTKNLISNSSEMWVNGGFEFDPLEEGDEEVSSGDVTNEGDMLRTVDPVLLEYGKTYTLSVRGDWVGGQSDNYIPIVAYTDAVGRFRTIGLNGGRIMNIATEETDIGVYIYLVHSIYDSDNNRWVQTNTASFVIGGDVLVQIEEGVQPSSWVPCAADLPQYTTIITAPDGLDLRDGALYTLTATAIDNGTGLSSETVTGNVSVLWSHQAPVPSDNAITVTPSDVTDDDGNRTRKCVIQLASPTGAASGDLFDVWRHTPDGYHIIAYGVPLTARVTDNYAPYGVGDYGYRVICRTADGDTAWNDYAYELPGRDVRIDFGDEYVELPYNVQLQDSYTKSFESREKLDGSIDGYWNESVQRKGSYSSDLIRIREPEKAAAVRRLAHHNGPCFVRTPDGCAYTANVEVNNFGGARRDGALAVSIDATEVSIAGEYQATLEDTEVTP